MSLRGATSPTRDCLGIPSLSEAHGDGPPPRIGDHNDYIFGEVIGLSPEEIKKGQESGAIR